MEYWKHRRPKVAASESQLERERKRVLAKLYPSSTEELVRVAADSTVQPQADASGRERRPDLAPAANVQLPGSVTGLCFCLASPVGLEPTTP